MRRLRVWSTWWALFALPGCRALPVVEVGVCGNKVVEPAADEDCDTIAKGGTVCRPPGEPNQCRFDCEANADGVRALCPPNWGCAADGTCRRPTGGFSSPTKLSADVSSWLAVVDFDGDERLDLISAEPADRLQQARFRLHYFDVAGKLAETRTFPRVTTRPVARRFDADGMFDLVFANFRIGMLPGRADRDWVPAAFSSYVVANSGLRVVGVRRDLVAGASSLAAFMTLHGVPGVYVPSFFDDGTLSVRAELSRPLQELAGDPIAADIASGDDSPCDELVFAFRGERVFRVLDMCRVGTAEQPALEVLWRDEPVEQVVTLPAGYEIDAGPLAADVDGDGHLDVLIGAVSVAGEPKTLVARGNGERLESAATGVDIRVFPEQDPGAPADMQIPLPLPLAAGDLSGDGVADFVLPREVLTSRQSLVSGEVAYFSSYANAAQPWTMATIADLNGNALPDVVAAAAGEPGLTFLNGTGSPYQIAVRLSSHGPLRQLTTGDFDGDLILDVAYIEGGPPSKSTDELSVAFGARDGTPLSARRVAELSGVEQLSQHHELGLDSLFTASTDVVNEIATSTLTLFDGNPDRLPFAPYELVTFSVDGKLQNTFARALLVGGFTAVDANDVVVLGANFTDKPWNLWLIPNIGAEKELPRQLAVAPPANVLPFTPQTDGAFRLSVASAAADLDGDSFDEALWLMPEGTNACALLSYDIDGDAGQATLKSYLRFDEPCVTPELASADLNGDEWLDLLVLLGDPERAPRKLAVLWNDGAGGFSVDDQSVIGDAQRDVRAFSVFPKPDPRVAFVTERALSIATIAEGGEAFETIGEVAGFDDARALTVADPNTDHVSDVVVADAEGLWLVGAKLK